MTAGSDLAYKYAMATRAPWLLLVVSAAACAGAADRPGSASADARIDRSAAFDELPTTLDAAAPPDAAPLPDAADDVAATPETFTDVQLGEYPAGPYGAAVGQTLADMSFEGFVNPSAMGLASARPFVPTSMAALRAGGRRYAVVFIAEYLCTGCQAAARDMGAQARALTDMGATLVMVLSTRNYVASARRTDLFAWVDAYQVPVTCVIDAPGEPPLSSQRNYGPHDAALLVDLATMRVLVREQNFTTRSAFARIIPELTRRLATP